MTAPDTTTSWHSYARLYAVGHGAIKELLFDDVIVEEKVDGSQFSFGVINGEIKCRSKGSQIDINAPEKMFIKAVNTVKELAPILTPNWTYRAEYLQSPKHNTLAYDRTPTKHLIVFDINSGHEVYLTYDEKKAECERIGLECIPLIHSGVLAGMDSFSELLDRVSVLGGVKVEGFVIKNYKRFTIEGKAQMGKFVSEAFKEVHKTDWKERCPGNKDIVQSLGIKYTTPARWMKAVQHLKEAGQLTDTPKDIGALIKEVQRDILEECKPEIAETLFNWAWDQISRTVIKGLPQWYKLELAKKQFE